MVVVMGSFEFIVERKKGRKEERKEGRKEGRKEKKRNSSTLYSQQPLKKGLLLQG